MRQKKRGQAAFEYLSTYGWAFLSALIAVGALAYFGFLNPTKLLPSNCDFGKQLDCVEYRLMSDNTANARADLFLRNNFGKPINIIGVGGDAIGIDGSSPSGPLPFTINSGAQQEVRLTLNNPQNYLVRDKKEARLLIRFERADATSPPEHNISGMVFTTVQRI